MKHANGIVYTARTQSEPKHSAGWAWLQRRSDVLCQYTPYTPGRHAKPFGKHHPATPVTYDKAGTTTPLTTPAPNLDVAA